MAGWYLNGVEDITNGYIGQFRPEGFELAAEDNAAFSQTDYRRAFIINRILSAQEIIDLDNWLNVT